MGAMKVLITEEELQSRIVELAQQIDREYEGREITLISILKGSVFFAVELAKNISGPVKFEFIKVSSYGSSTESTGEIKMDLDLHGSIRGKEVLVVEDIIDTGKTLSYLLKYLNTKEPKSIKLCTLLDKPERRLVDVDVNYVGFAIPDEFVVGFGLDFNEEYRNLPYIGYFEKEISPETTEPPKRLTNKPIIKK